MICLVCLICLHVEYRMAGWYSVCIYIVCPI